MPKLWTHTIQAHRREVRDATLDTAAALVAKVGPLSVTMSQIAEETGIGRATLYKYFPDVEAILVAWHERQVARHLEHLAEVRDRASGASARLAAVLEAYALISHEHHGTDLSAFLHQGPHMRQGQHIHQGQHIARAQQQLRNFLRELVSAAAKAGEIRDDVPPEELVSYCLGALTASSNLPSKAAVHRLVTVVLSALRPTA